jgi:hypothetical protein
MGAFEQQNALITKFFAKAKETGLYEKVNDSAKRRLDQHILDLAAFRSPESVSRDFKLQLTVFTNVFDRSHELLGALNGIAEGWAKATSTVDKLLAETGALVFGEDEDDDLQRLEKLPPIIVAHFGLAALPPALKGDDLKKQLHAHRKAEVDMPKTSAGAALKQARAEKRRLNKEGKELAEVIHDLLDAEFGRKGEAAYKKKSEYGYERRVAAPRKTAEEKKAEEKKTEAPADATSKVANG